jgi:hypothetical protein
MFQILATLFEKAQKTKKARRSAARFDAVRFP